MLILITIFMFIFALLVIYKVVVDWNQALNTSAFDNVWMFVGHKSCCTAASSRNGAIGWISMQGYGNLTKAVGIPCKAWKSIQCMESPPGAGWKSNQVLRNTWMEIQPSYSKIHNDNPQKLMSNMKVNVNCCNLMKVKVNCYNPKSLNDEMNVFFFSRNGKDRKSVV